MGSRSRMALGWVATFRSTSRGEDHSARIHIKLLESLGNDLPLQPGFICIPLGSSRCRSRKSGKRIRLNPCSNCLTGLDALEGGGLPKYAFIARPSMKCDWRSDWTPFSSIGPTRLLAPQPTRLRRPILMFAKGVAATSLTRAFEKNICARGGFKPELLYWIKVKRSAAERRRYRGTGTSPMNFLSEGQCSRIWPYQPSQQISRRSLVNENELRSKSEWPAEPNHLVLVVLPGLAYVAKETRSACYKCGQRRLDFSTVIPLSSECNSARLISLFPPAARTLSEVSVRHSRGGRRRWPPPDRRGQAASRSAARARKRVEAGFRVPSRSARPRRCAV